MTVTEAFLSKIQETSDTNSPFYGATGELNLINVLLDFFAAGSDTTAVTLNWAMLFMILNPSMTTLLEHSCAYPRECSFLPKKLISTNNFFVGLVFSCA